MKFRLIFHGQIPSAGNKSRPNDAARIRKQFSSQLKFLWENNKKLKDLQENAFLEVPSSNTIVDPSLVTPRQKYNRNRQGWRPLLDCREYKDYNFLPLVTESLSLGCEIDILMLRQEEPGVLISQTGDIDGRVKVLFDALRMPKDQELDVTKDTNRPDPEEINYCLLEDDSLITGFTIDTDRLLFPETEHQHECHIVMEVKVNVLTAGPHNMCLL